jgi:catechol 2,3-dioxygenase-like lactoylglutathione lyase family enzyme
MPPGQPAGSRRSSRTGVVQRWNAGILPAGPAASSRRSDNHFMDNKPEPNVRQVVPFFGVKDMQRSLRFYLDGLGFEMTLKWIDEGKLRWCWLQLGGAALMLQEYRAEFVPAEKLGEGVTICFTCNDALAIYREAKPRGLDVARPFVGNGMWVANLSDPDGYKLSFQSKTDAPEESVLPEEEA